MNKKTLMMGLGIVVGSTLLISSAYAGIGSSTGYEAYKSAVKTMHKVDNVTGSLVVTVKDNERTLLTVNSQGKFDKASQTGSGKMEVKGGTADQSLSFYSQEGKKIVKNSAINTYNVFEMEKDGHQKWKKHHQDIEDHSFNQEAENIIDSLVGDLKNDMTLENNTDGTKVVNLSLKGSQLPMIVNTLASVIVKNGSQHLVNGALATSGEQSKLLLTDNWSHVLPKLEKDIQIKLVQVKAEINKEDRITHQEAVLTISGKDQDGAAHEVTISFDLQLSEFNNTVPDQIDLTGKEVKIWQEDDIENLVGEHKKHFEQ